MMADHYNTPIGPRLTERGRTQVMSGKYRLPVVCWCDPDFEAPIKSNEIAFIVPILLKIANLTDGAAVLESATKLPGALGQLACFSFCHWNPLGEEWSSPRLKMRSIASFNVAFWLAVTIFISLFSGAWLTVSKYYCICAALLFIMNFICFKIQK